MRPAARGTSGSRSTSGSYSRASCARRLARPPTPRSMPSQFSSRARDYPPAPNTPLQRRPRCSSALILRSARGTVTPPHAPLLPPTGACRPSAMPVRPLLPPTGACRPSAMPVRPSAMPVRPLLPPAGACRPSARGAGPMRRRSACSSCTSQAPPLTRARISQRCRRFSRAHGRASATHGRHHWQCLPTSRPMLAAGHALASRQSRRQAGKPRRRRRRAQDAACEGAFFGSSWSGLGGTSAPALFAIVSVCFPT